MKNHLEITDMPSDTLGALGKLRTVLVGTFNRAREHKHRMTLLKTVLKFMYNKCVEFEKAQELADDEVRKVTLEEAVKLKIDLDERLSTENLVAELKAAKLAKTAQTAKTTTEQKETK